MSYTKAERKVAHILNVDCALVRDAGLSEEELQTVVHSCTEGRLKATLPSALYIVVMMLSAPVALLDARAVPVFLASAACLPWALVRSMNYQNHLANHVRDMKLAANDKGKSYEVSQNPYRSDLTVSGLGGSLAESFREFSTELKELRSEVKEIFTYRNLKERIFKKPTALAIAFLCVASPSSIFVIGRIAENSTPFVDRFRAEFAQVAGDQQESYILFGAGVFHSRAYGRMTYQGPEGVRCALEIEQPLNFWGTKETGPEKRQQVCGADVEPVTLFRASQWSL